MELVVITSESIKQDIKNCVICKYCKFTYGEGIKSRQKVTMCQTYIKKTWLKKGMVGWDSFTREGNTKKNF